MWSVCWWVASLALSRDVVGVDNVRAWLVMVVIGAARVFVLRVMLAILRDMRQVVSTVCTAMVMLMVLVRVPS